MNRETPRLARRFPTGMLQTDSTWVAPWREVCFIFFTTHRCLFPFEVMLFSASALLSTAMLASKMAEASDNTSMFDNFVHVLYYLLCGNIPKAFQTLPLRPVGFSTKISALWLRWKCPLGSMHTDLFGLTGVRKSSIAVKIGTMALTLSQREG